MGSPIVPIIIIVSILVVAIGFVLMLVIRSLGAGRKRSVPEKVPFGSTMDKETLCPKCHHPMNSGFIRAERGIIWRSVDDKPASAFGYLWNTSLLKNTMTMGFKLKVNQAWRCFTCGLVLFDQSHQIEPPKREH
jgi:hypothetical protein